VDEGTKGILDFLLATVDGITTSEKAMKKSSGEKEYEVKEREKEKQREK
jgi:hypothetical protein